ncbi:hypothetical protein J3458_016504 [Metarhizium acridum]|uniref:uncharacterized protein n=1 Tax=Metarhizium acridum TaxID=92637 RepID=UPI001C6B4C33|nr:hypothetical protein J3458_016504 [Metarhizium acridum]
MSLKTYSAQTPADLKELSSRHDGLTVILQLTSKQLMSSASNWTRLHLLVYRLITGSETSFLEPFEGDHNDACPICQLSKELPTQQIDLLMLRSLLEDITPSELLQPESKLLQSPWGYLKVALAQASHTSVTDAPKPREERKKPPVEKYGSYTNSWTAILGSSSPLGPSSSEYEMEFEDVDEDENEARQSIPEDISVHLAIAIIRCVLLCLKQPGEQEEVRARVERIKVQATIAGFDGIMFEDDAGMSFYCRQNYGWKLVHPFITMVEAKRAFKYIRKDTQSGRSSPMVSDNVLAQYLAQAVLAWQANPSLLHKGVFLMAVVNTFVQFIYFTFGSDYREYIEATTAEEQLRVVNNPEKDTFVYMARTKWYDLRMSEGRRLTACTLLTRLRQILPKLQATREGAMPSPRTHTLESDSDDLMYSDNDFNDGNDSSE